jgi:integrase
LNGDWELEEPFLDAMAKAALALYLHTGLRSGELRHAKLKDLNLGRLEIVVSKPKGHGAWASGTESTPIMPGAGPALLEYLRTRDEHLRQTGLNPDEVEPLFPYIRKDGRVVYWTQQLWTKMKASVERVTGIRFKWKDCRPSYAQMLKDKGASIEDVSKALRHSSTVTTERFYARVRSETAFSRLRQV